MKQVWKRWWFWLFLVLVGSSGSLIGYCRTHRVWSVNQWRVYQAMEQECHPVWREFHFGRIRAGDDVEMVIAQTEPVRVKRDGHWVILKYHRGGLCYTGLTAAAYDGRMVGAFAWSCTWIRQFFNTMSTEQQEEFFSKYYDQFALMGNAIVVR